MRKHIITALFASGCLLAGGFATSGQAFAADAIKLAADAIGGTVTGAKGPEAGVWVVAETSDLPTKYAKMVVTDDKGRYVLPQMPDAKYKVWVRGYGLIDSKAVEAKPGAHLDLTATPAPDAKSAAEYYPSAYWYALLNPPPASDFPGTGPEGNGIAVGLKTQQHWLENMKENCMFCHQIGDKATREMAPTGNSKEAWAQRITMARAVDDPAIGNNGKFLAATMGNNMARFGKERGISMYADWTDRIAAGELPHEAPPRPEGVERNIVVTVRDWGGDHYIHDQISSDHRDPNVNANGPIYGMGTLTGYLEIFDPKTLKNTHVPIPSLDGSQKHNNDAQIHADEMDAKGRVWMPTIYKEGVEAAYCKDGSTPFSKYYPLNYDKAAVLPMYDPATGKVEVIPLCVGGNHSNFTFDKESKLYFSGDNTVISWIDTKLWDETHDVKQATGWCPMVVDTSGDGKIDPDRTHWNVQAPPTMGGGEGSERKMQMLQGTEFDPKKDTLLNVHLYGMTVARDGSVWEAAYVPYVPSAIVHMIPGAHPPETCKTEIYQPPLQANGKYPAFGVRGVGTDAEGNAYAAFSSGQVGKFDRRKCKVLNGPTATGQQCPEGWTFYDLPSPHVGNTSATSDFVYSGWDDWTGVMGLGKDTMFFPAINSDSVLAMPKGSDKFVKFRVPYPLGFYTRGVDFRVDDPKAGWKGKTLQATYASAAQWHQEDGEGSNSKIVTFQMRPDPLAD